MGSRVRVVATGCVVGSLAVIAPMVGPLSSVGAVQPTASAVHTLTRASVDLRLSSNEAAHVVATRASDSASLGAVTFVNNDLNSPDAVNVSLAQAGTNLGVLDGLESGEYTAPQILPTGGYTVTVTDARTGAGLTSGSLSVTAGSDTSAVVSLPAALTTYNDLVGSVPNGQDVVSLRNTLAVAQNFYFNGARVASAVAPGMSTDIVVSSGAYAIGIANGSGAVNTVGTLIVSKDVYVPVYVVADAAFSTGGVTLTATPFAQGYQFTAADGGVFNYGAYPFQGSTGGTPLNAPVIGGVEASTESGYWLAASDGGVFAFGAPFAGSLGSTHLDAPIVAVAATVGTNGGPGYLLAASDGGVFAFNAGFYGSLGGSALTSPVVGIAADEAGGYIIVQANGTATSFSPGAAPVQVNSLGHLNAPIVAISETPDGGGAWLVAADGGVFPVGDAGFYGSAATLRLNQPIVGIQTTFDGLGYELIAKDGGIFTYGNATFYGSTGNVRLNQPIVGAINNG
jgi:hypothetical protein